MTPEIALTLLLLVATIVAFSAEWLPIDVTALLLLVVLVATGLLGPDKVLAGFADDIIIMLACVFVISGALARSGLPHRLAGSILEFARNQRLLVPTLMAGAASISAFFSNTSATAMLMPTTLEISRKAGLSPSRTLMPLAFASILGGTCTLIGTSTNLASAGLISRLGLEPYSFFEFLAPGLLLTVIGIAYLSIVGYRFVPRREKDHLTDDYDIRDYLSELLIGAASPAVGERLASLGLAELDIAPLAIIRDRRKLPAHGNRKLRAGDKIIVRSARDALLLARDRREFSIEAESTLTDQDLSGEDVGFREVILMPRSRIVGKSMKELDFYNHHGVAALALFRRGQAYPAQIEHMKLRVGDVLLVQGPKQQLERLSRDPDLWTLESRSARPLSTRKGLYAVCAMAGAIVAGSTGLLPVSVAFLAATVLLLLVGATTMEEAYASIEWRVLVLIACMGGFGVAIQDTGTAAYLAELIADAAATMGLRATLAAFAFLTVILTQPMSNAAAALVVLPVAVSTALLLGVDPRPFAVMVTLSASMSFITPLEPASLLVFGIGKYRFVDFVKVGLPLTVIVIAVLVMIVPVLWPLQALKT